ncbi:MULTISPECIES: HAD family hydrolase [unclassified Streptomyces]|uniref:HAD family hydrolase n=1 Tax=unclassified Streptomyces TaxID=2593676 RepID=UPI0021564079|nr:MULTISPECIES: HAD family hydrolase [unclassified Streptomyces]
MPDESPDRRSPEADDSATYAAVLDVDGTLVDTNYLHCAAWWEAFRQVGHHIPMREIHHALGLPGGELIAHLLGEDRDPDRDEVLRAAHKTLYGTYFSRLLPLPGAADLLRELAAGGWHVVLATSADGEELDALRRAIDADDAIHSTASSDDVSEGKPAPEPVHRARELAAGTPPERTVFVGDSVWDMRAATRAGATAVGLTCGGISEADLRDAGATETHRDPRALLDALHESAFARVRPGAVDG